MENKTEIMQCVFEKSVNFHVAEIYVKLISVGVFNVLLCMLFSLILFLLSSY